MECLGNQIVIAHIIWLQLYLLKWSLKETLFVLCAENDSCACKRSCMLKKVNVHTDGSSSLPQKMLLLQLLVSSPAFNSVTLWHYTMSPCHICIIYTHQLYWTHKHWFRSGVCELTNQSRLGRDFGKLVLKETGEYTVELQHWTVWDVFFEH